LDVVRAFAARRAALLRCLDATLAAGDEPVAAAAAAAAPAAAPAFQLAPFDIAQHIQEHKAAVAEYVQIAQKYLASLP
jgi:hypothetical protein